MSFTDLFQFVLRTFDREEALLAENVRHFSNSVINKESDVEDQWLRHRRRWLFIEKPADDASRGQLKQQDDLRSVTGKAGPTDYVVAVFVLLGRSNVHSPWLLASGRSFLLFPWVIDAGIEHNGFKHVKNKVSDLFAIFTSSEGAVLCLCPGLRHFVILLDDGKNKLHQKLALLEIALPPHLLLISHSYQHHAEADNNG